MTSRLLKVHAAPPNRLCKGPYAWSHATVCQPFVKLAAKITPHRELVTCSRCKARVEDTHAIRAIA